MKSKNLFALGDLLKDRVTGFKGIVIATTEWLNGCVRLTLQPQGLNKDGKVHDTLTLDVEQLELVKAAVAAPSPTKTGGPMPEIRRI